MKNKVKKFMLIRFNQYMDIELKLETMAKKGLFLEKARGMFWTFKKGEPKNLKYTVTYFPEASIFNPTITPNQQKYFNAAKELGWNIVAELNQMQIFCSEDENPRPFETDEKEKFEAIKTCMRKNFVPSTIIMIFLFMLNLWLQYNSYKIDKVDFLAVTTNLFPVAMMLPTALYLIYTLIAYFIWYRQSEKSLSMGGRCIDKTHRYQKIIDSTFIFYGLILTTLFSYGMLKSNNLIWFISVIIPFLMIILITCFSVQYFKRKKKSAKFNRIASGTLVIVASFTYLFFMMIFIMGSDIPHGKKKDYRTVTWQTTETETREYRIYNDDIPLKCEDLYGETSYDNYSYKKDNDNSIFLTRSEYRQDCLPDKDLPLEIKYTIIEPKFNFISKIVVEDLKTQEKWSDEKIAEISPLEFNAKEAYQFYYRDMECRGKYLLIYKDKIILLNLEQKVTKQQAAVIVEKLKL